MVGCVEGILECVPDFYGLRIAPSILSSKEWGWISKSKKISAAVTCTLKCKIWDMQRVDLRNTVNGEELKDNYIPQEKLTAETEVELYLS